MVSNWSSVCHCSLELSYHVALLEGGWMWSVIMACVDVVCKTWMVGVAMVNIVGGCGQDKCGCGCGTTWLARGTSNSMEQDTCHIA